MRNILVATDLQQDSENAFIRAIQLSRLSGATLHVLHVAHRLQVPNKTDETALLHGEVSDQIRDFVRGHAGSSNLEVVTHVENHGRVHERIIQHVRTVHANLVVIGRSMRDDVLPDSVFLTTGQVLANTPAPVLVVTQPVSGNYRRIVLEADLSIPPDTLIRPVREFGPDMRLTLLIRSGVESDGSGGLVKRLIAGLRRRKREKFEARIALLLQQQGLPPDRVSVDFVARDYEAVLLSKLDDNEIDLVGLVGMRQKLFRRDFGIHIIAAMQTAKCDILAKSTRR